MRTILKAGIYTATVAAGAFFLAIGAVSAADRSEQANEGRAYLSLEFGGAKIAPRNLHYGLRVDQDRRLFAEEATQAPLMQFDFTTRGMSDMRVNGLSVLKQSHRLQQTEGEAPAEDGAEAEAEAGAEEEGFFEGAWHGVTGFFGGLFGGGDDDEEVPAEETAEAAAEEAPEEVAEGTFMGYNAVDWGLLAIGAVGVGFVASEVSNGDEDPTLVDSDGDGIADPPGGGGGGGCPPGTTPNPLPIGDPCVPIASFAGRNAGPSAILMPVDYREWLDSGTGHMGDLGG